jgi:hypothetical protein
MAPRPGPTALQPWPPTTTRHAEACSTSSPAAQWRSAATRRLRLSASVGGSRHSISTGWQTRACSRSSTAGHRAARGPAPVAPRSCTGRSRARCVTGPVPNMDDHADDRRPGSGLSGLRRLCLSPADAPRRLPRTRRARTHPLRRPGPTPVRTQPGQPRLARLWLPTGRHRQQRRSSAVEMQRVRRRPALAALSLVPVSAAGALGCMQTTRRPTVGRVVTISAVVDRSLLTRAPSLSASPATNQSGEFRLSGC